MPFIYGKKNCLGMVHPRIDDRLMMNVIRLCALCCVDFENQGPPFCD